MPSLEWNEKWERMIAGFEPGDAERHFGDRWGHPDHHPPLIEVRRRFIDPYFRPGQAVAEIGSGGGRWTAYLTAAARLVVVEYNPAAFAYLERRFPGVRFDFYRTSGFEMAGVAAASVDFVFTFDVFVHLESDGILAYLREIERILRPGAVAVVHYGDVDKLPARLNPGFSRLTRKRMEALVGETGLAAIDHDVDLLVHSNLVALRREL